MKRPAADSLLALVQTFFADHLRRVRGASEHTVRAYRDALRLFFLFLADHLGRSIADLRLDDIRADAVLAFLHHIESKRGNGVITRNCRLAAIRSFAAHILRHDITLAEQYARILSIPAKRAQCRVVSYLEPEDVRAVIAAVDGTNPRCRRDRALLLLLYNTGARVSEALAIRPAISKSNGRVRCGSMARVERKGSAHCGPRPSPPYGRFQAPGRMNRCSAMGAALRSHATVSRTSSPSTSVVLQRRGRGSVVIASRRTSYATAAP